MNALARALNVQAPKDSGNLASGRVVRAVAAPQALAPAATVSAQHIRHPSEGLFVTQCLVFDQQTWAARNLTRVLGVFDGPSDDEMAAATEAVKSLKARENEDVRAWAKALGETFGSFTD